jgi:hypothetical protein
VASAIKLAMVAAMSQPSFLEHVFDLARSGRFGSVSELRKHLRREGYSDNQLFGRSLIAELGRLCRAAHQGLESPPPRPEKKARRLLTPEERSAAARRGAETRSRMRRLSISGSEPQA